MCPVLLTRTAFALKGSVEAKAEMQYITAEYDGFVDAEVHVTSRSEASLEGTFDVSKGGASGIAVDLSTSATIEAVAFKGQAAVEKEFSLISGILDVKAGVDVEGNLLGLGVAGEAGFKTLKSKPGVAVKAGLGLTALIGAKIKGSVELSLNLDRVREIRDGAVKYINEAWK